jgi:hypothetical protein
MSIDFNFTQIGNAVNSCWNAHINPTVNYILEEGKQIGSYIYVTAHLIQPTLSECAEQVANKVNDLWNSNALHEIKKALVDFASIICKDGNDFRNTLDQFVGQCFYACAGFKVAL